MIIVFARAPVPGRAKTRLIPRLGAWRAARLHARLTRRAVDTAVAAGCGAVELHGTARHSFFSSLKVPFRLQRGRDLGECMWRAMTKALQRHSFVILVGSDCPMLTPADLRRAARWLRGGCDVVLAPAEDGGYALIGVKKAIEKKLFENIAWGGPRVYADTVKKLQGARWRALRAVWDVDRPEDLPRLAELRLRSLRFASAARRGARR
jgi:uncharacterized protein